MNLVLREAKASDLDAIVDLLWDDELGRERECQSEQDLRGYARAFGEICEDPNNELVVGEHEGRVVAVLQLTFIPGLTLKGMRRALVEGVRVNRKLRGRGFGAQLIRFAIQRAKDRNCGLIQLTSNKRRVDAIRFYVRLGFEASHEGFKLMLG